MIELRKAAAQELARRSPANLAEYASEGRWQPYGLHKVLNDRLMRAARGEGTRRIMINLPPQHGKSTLSSKYFPAWWLGLNPDKRIILSSYAAEYAEIWGRQVRDVLNAHGAELFGISVRSDSSAAGRWDVCDSKDGKPREGGMSAVGIGGATSGKKADLFLIDDPVKDDEEAQSEVEREKKYEWYKSVALTRMSERGVIVLIMTRWHESDLAGKLIKDQEAGTGEIWEVIRLPAIAEEREEWRGSDGGLLFARQKGDPLCPELFSIGTLLKRQGALGDYSWARLYQQRPFAKGGGLFNIQRLRENTVTTRPPHVIRARGWDFAATKKDYSDRSAGVLISKNMDGRFFIEHCVAGKWNPDERNDKMKHWAEKDKNVKILFEQDPAQAGEDQALAIVRMLTGHRVEPVKQMGRNKEVRADVVASQVNVGNVSIVDDGSWDVEGFLHELEAFPNGDHDDRVDALSVAFNWLFPQKVVIGSGQEKQKLRTHEEQSVMGIGPSDWRKQWPGGTGPSQAGDDRGPGLVNRFGQDGT